MFERRLLQNENSCNFCGKKNCLLVVNDCYCDKAADFEDRDKLDYDGYTFEDEWGNCDECNEHSRICSVCGKSN